MAEASPSIFNKKATEKLRSPDDLDKYVRVTNPSVWVVLVACVALLAGLATWGFFGVVTTNVSTYGALVDTKLAKKSAQNLGIDDQTVAICFLTAEDVTKVEVGDDTKVGDVEMKVKTISPIPASPDEWQDALGSSYLAKTLFKDDWAYPVSFEGDISNVPVGVPVSVVITTDEVSPISLILKNWG